MCLNIIRGICIAIFIVSALIMLYIFIGTASCQFKATNETSEYYIISAGFLVGSFLLTMLISIIKHFTQNKDNKN